MNYPVSRSDIYMAKHVTNEIEFYLKDIDRKPVVLTDAMVMRISDRIAGKVLLTLVLDLVDPTKAHYRATVPPGAIEDLELGFYAYAMTRRAADGSERLLYADRSRAEFGSVEVREGPLPPETAAREIAVDAFYPRDGYLFSGAYAGSAAVASFDGVMSVGIYGNGFTGSVTVQGVLDDAPSPNDLDWFDIASAEFENLAGLSGFTVQANVTFVRFRVKDDTDPNYAFPAGGTNCLACYLPDSEPTVPDTAIDWPPETPQGLVKIAFRA